MVEWMIKKCLILNFIFEIQCNQLLCSKWPQTKTFLWFSFVQMSLIQLSDFRNIFENKFGFLRNIQNGRGTDVAVSEICPLSKKAGRSFSWFQWLSTVEPQQTNKRIDLTWWSIRSTIFARDSRCTPRWTPILFSPHWTAPNFQRSYFRPQTPPPHPNGCVTPIRDIPWKIELVFKTFSGNLTAE